MDSTQAQSGGFRTPERWNSVPVPERVALRAYTNVDKLDDGCWISRYSVASHGYSQIGWRNRGDRHVVLGHRAAWVHVNGQMPLGMTIDHTCKVRRCVNPDHMRMLPNYENARRTSGRDWPLGYCVNGHPNSELVEATATAKDGSRRRGRLCGVCARESQARYAARVASGEHTPVRRRPTACRHGHDMTGDRAVKVTRGEWVCRECRRLSAARHYAKKRALR